MGKWINGGYSPPTFLPYPKVCPDSQSTAFDERSGRCFKIYGLGIAIGPFSTSYQGGFEVCNLNFHMDGTSRPVTIPLGLNSMVA